MQKNREIFYLFLPHKIILSSERCSRVSTLSDGLLFAHVKRFSVLRTQDFCLFDDFHTLLEGGSYVISHMLHVTCHTCAFS